MWRHIKSKATIYCRRYIIKATKYVKQMHGTTVWTSYNHHMAVWVDDNHMTARVHHHHLATHMEEHHQGHHVGIGQPTTRVLEW